MISGIEGLSFMADVAWMATETNVSQVVRKLKSRATLSIDRAATW
jgi:hypothetical protein